MATCQIRPLTHIDVFRATCVIVSAFKTSQSFKIRRPYSEAFPIDTYDFYAVDLINAFLSPTSRVYGVESLYNENEAKVVKSPWARQDSTVSISETVISGVLVISGLEPQPLPEGDIRTVPPSIQYKFAS